ncbi:LPS assembly protein LptD [Rhodobacter sp. Har01]|uniref:LPS-assembly protein LptD n=1 Tax=Rhodobacter sp. Har01 TaxID=2883999 RepID=UPI001D097D77|nr:LPS assembly protein LptD [Rhodobacter sp. Har01]MCB6177289.1 LPS assembly protein LptD [Rhodobacter sp. Har01]
MRLPRFLCLGLAALALALAAPAQVQAQDRATLVSDRLEIADDSRLIASGNVEVFFRGTRLRASRIVYDQAGDRLLIDGPIALIDDTGKALILASAAELSADLTEGVLESARLVLNQQLQLASNRMMRVAGRYTALDRVVASSCQVCAEHPVPLWEIRARRVVHDQMERQLYFDHAQFRVAGVPVFYIPRLRMPDPTLDRATGFLMPQLRTTSGLGTGLKIPYFIALGPSRDLTLTPYFSTKAGRTLELRYRQAFATGMIEIAGAVSRDELVLGDTRGYLETTGAFDLPNSFKLTFKGITASDPAYLLDYGISDADRLDSRIELTRTRRNGYFAGRIISLQTLRDDEENTTIPGFVTDLTFHRRFSLGALGGEGGFRLQTHSHVRTSTNPADGADLDSIADGRDMSRISARVDWRRSFILPAGIEATILGEAQAEAFTIAQDASFAGEFSRVHSAAGVELRWPWVKTTGRGATHVIEPVIQLVWAGQHGADIPNEDSALVEFDEGNLFSLDRFPGSDAVEEGARVNLGVTWTRHDPAGWSMGLTLGRVLRDRNYGQFGPASGLGGGSSDWLVAANVDWQSGLAATGRLVFDDSFSLSKGEVRLSLNRDRLALATSALWAEADLSENRPDRTREFTFDALWKVAPSLSAMLSGSYDFEAERGTLAGLGVEFRNECVTVNLSLSRRFTSSTSVTPTTDFGLSVDLVGFGSGTAAGPSRRCR